MIPEFMIFFFTLYYTTYIHYTTYLHYLYYFTLLHYLFTLFWKIYLTLDRYGNI